MHAHPFALLRPLKDHLDVRMLTRKDTVSSDADIARVTGAATLASLEQVHGNRCVVLRSPSHRIEKADALATDVKNLTLTIRFADCQNFIVFDPVKKILCLIHAGWRGVIEGAISEAFLCLRREWGVDPKNVLIGAGPSLCKKHAEFTDPKKEVPELATYAERRCIDLNRAADDQLFALGVTKDHFERMNECTMCSSDRYWAYRSGEDAVVKEVKRNCLLATLV